MELLVSESLEASISTFRYIFFCIEGKGSVWASLEYPGWPNVRGDSLGLETCA